MSDIRQMLELVSFTLIEIGGPLEKPKPLIIRLDLPLFLNRPPI